MAVALSRGSRSRSCSGHLHPTYNMKRFLIAALSCSTCLFAAAPAMAGPTSAQIEATGTMPATCEVGGAQIELKGDAGSPLMAGRGEAFVSTNGKSVLSLSEVTLEAPRGASGIIAAITLGSEGIGIISQNTNGNGVYPKFSRIETPLLVNPTVDAVVRTDKENTPLPAGFYSVTSTLTCLSDSQPETPAATTQPALSNGI